MLTRLQSLIVNTTEIQHGTRVSQFIHSKYSYFIFNPDRIDLIFMLTVTIIVKNVIVFDVGISSL